jgi:hypothetical protein
MNRKAGLDALKLPAQPEDVGVEPVLTGAEVIAGPQCVDQFRLRHDPAGPRQERVGDRRLDRGEFDHPAVDAEDAEIGIEFRVARADGRVRRRRRDKNNITTSHVIYRST